MPLTNEKIEAIRKAAILTNPEIVELKFGCVIQMTGAKQPDFIKTPVPITSVKPMSDGCWETPWGCFHPKTNKKEFIIIGRPITLADVLLAAYKANSANKTLLNVESDGQFLNGLTKTLGPTWNLRKDDLALQDEATISFIYDLIK